MRKHTFDGSIVGLRSAFSVAGIKLWELLRVNQHFVCDDRTLKEHTRTKEGRVKMPPVDPLLYPNRMKLGITMKARIAALRRAPRQPKNFVDSETISSRQR